MAGSKVPAIRRRILRDAAFRERLHAAFHQTLDEEGLLIHLTEAQVEELRLVLYLRDLFRSAAPAEGPATIVPLFRPDAHPVAEPEQPEAAGTPEPVDFVAWCARRRYGR